jgi:hypothetical protein
MRVRRRLIAAAFGGAMVLGGPWAGAQNAAPSSRIDELRRTLAGEPAWAADYRQEYVPAGMTIGEEAAGRVWLSWPDRALFHTGSPPVRLMGLEERLARLVDVEAGSCDEHRLSDREWERFPLAALLDPSGASEHFELADAGDAGLVLRPRETGGVDRIEIELGGDGLPAEVVIVDPQGATNRLRFVDWRSIDGPPAGEWLPAVPPGFECVADPGALE